MAPLPHVSVIMGGPSTEHAVSLASGRMVFEALDRSRYRVSALVIHRDGRWERTTDPAGVPLVPEGAPPRPRREEAIRGAALLADVDLAFLALHGTFGEDGTIQGFLETLGVPYTGSGRLASALAMDKVMAKRVFRQAGLPVAAEILVDRATWQADRSGVLAAVTALGPVVAIKPNVGGSSVGVSRAEGEAAAAEGLAAALAVAPAALVEPWLDGAEITVAVLEDADGEPRPLPPVAIRPRRGRFFDFASKYETGGADEICPAPLDPADAESLGALALEAHRALGARGLSRADFILTPGGPVLLEVNTLPGLTPNSLLPKAAAAAGLPFPRLVDRIVQRALAAV
ncbi:D-alanine--D-alanine ligase [Candidatus Hydrogenisulfobacillus filiaventi]|uniref:D-alanine--D-alanine ligase n=1 Tax=Candidatus Hydrogenisulfobacillus filiaventi TaxID=2707344 RepID=A0A6F8ZK31_9FIRM|nr:D-alanine--D-alanine ligase [Candidatus Hydrogenisulfobacillus filiaventi]